jgi:SAM-dependent methyltransferase
MEVPANTAVVNEKIETFLAHDETLFDFVLASHVFIHVRNVPDVLAALWGRVVSGGRMAIVMLNGHSAYRDFVWEFAPDVNPDLSTSGYKSSHLEKDMDELRLPWRRNVITTSLVAPSVDEFLSISSMHFNTEADDLSDDLVARMRAHLEPHLTEDGEVNLDVQHGIYVIER